MADQQTNSKLIPVIAVAVVITAVVLGLTKYKIPPKNATVQTSNTNTLHTNQNTTHMTYTFPGVLPDDQIANQQARIKTPKGEIVFSLDSVQAPLAVSNFVYLAKLGYFNGLTWHRVVPHFVIQGGDPTGTGMGGPGYQFEDETVTGEYTAGTVAMANAGPNTNGSQFFIVLEDQPTLPKSYTIFGHVTAGLDVVQKIVQGDTMDTVTIEPKS